MSPLHDVNATGSSDRTVPPVPRPRPGHPGRPSRSGQPWTDDDYERLVALVREGHGIARIADALDRTEGAVTPRLRALLPPEQRAILADRVLPTLRDHVRERPDYPWAEVMVTMPPPAPIVEEVVHRAGIAGLESELLAEVAWAVLHCETAASAAVRQVCREAEARGLGRDLEERLATALQCRVPPVTPAEASYAARARLDVACGRSPALRGGHDPYRGYGASGDSSYDLGW
jgi:hypothetical protein